MAGPVASAASIISLTLCAAISGDGFAKPAWADDASKLNGRVLDIVCFGEGPAVDIARDEAMSSCRSSATLFLPGRTEVQIKKVETEKEVIYVEKAETKVAVDGLACQPLAESIERGRDSVSAWIKCRFDLRKASVTERLPPATDRDGIVPEVSRSSTRRLVITTIPQCTDIVVLDGKRSIFHCDTNPTSIVLEGAATAILVRAAGYEPKKIDVSGVGHDGSISVTFE